jgi:hypothetical protein
LLVDEAHRTPKEGVPDAEGSAFLRALRDSGPLRTVELRPPPAGLAGGASVDRWIDLNQGVRSLLRGGRFVLFTDDAVGDREEESLQHLTTNLGSRADLSHVVPFLTLKHSLDYALLFARRTASHGLGGITVTGGDREVGLPRCLPRSRDLRRLIHEQHPGLPLGAWANPYRGAAAQADLLADPEHAADYYVTQIVSHHDLGPLSQFLEEADRRGVTLPGVVGVFYYRSGNSATLAKLSRFIPVPAGGLKREFADGASPAEICARTLRALADLGVEKTYVSNLDPRRAEAQLQGVEGLL